MTIKHISLSVGAIMLVATLAFAGSRVIAGHGHGHHCGGGDGPGMEGKHEEMMGQMLAKLNLTDAQKASIKSLRDQFQADNAPALQQMKALREQMMQLKQSGSKD